MSARLQWKSTTSGEEGVFVLRDRPVRLVAFADGHLDRAGTDNDGSPGVLVHPPDEDGRLLIEARGGLLLESGGRDFDRVKLPPGGRVSYQVSGAAGELAAEGAAHVDDPLAGRELGGYQVRARIGNGAMGIVYRALQINLDREVALKVLNPKAAQSPLAVASFKREAVAAGRLSHPNLLQVYDVRNDHGLHFFSMEMVPGGDLEDRLRESGPLPWQEALGYVADAAQALAFAEEHHLVHRDVKPENLMLTVDGRVKLADLGMAATRGMVERESAGGTPHFLAPECVGGAVDHRADLYSLGCTLYRLLTGRTPFEGATVKEILRAHRDAEIPSVREHAPDAPAAVDELVSWLMAKDPDERPQHADEVVEACDEVLQGSKPRGMMIGLGAIAVVAIGIAIFFALKSPPETDPERIIVEVGGEEAEAERQRAEAAERETEYLRALTRPEGSERIAALEAFLAAHPEAEQAQLARDEIARLESLPEPGTVGNGGGATPAPSELAARLRELEEALGKDLQVRSFGAAHARLAGSDLPAEMLVPLLGRLKEATDTAFVAWEDAHATALAAGEFPEAVAQREAFRGAFGDSDVPAEWRARVDALAAAAGAAESAAAEQAFREARMAMVGALQGEVLPAVLRFDLAAAEAALDAAASGCTHVGLAEGLRGLKPLLASATRGAAAVRASLDGSGDKTFLEPLEGRRAFALTADADGVRMMVQQRGARVEQTAPWSAFRDPAAFGELVSALAAEDAVPADLRALVTVFGAGCVATELRAWSGLPSREDAAEVAAEAEAWRAAEPRPGAGTPDASLSEERLQLARVAALCEALAMEDHYLALQRGQEAGAHFGLLAAWLSDGGSNWQFLP